MVESQSPRLYGEFADWFHLLTAPEDYAEEAEFYLELFARATGHKPKTLLELGSGGGNMASHYTQHVTVTLVDLSPSMLAQSKRINPECEHIAGDMRTIRLARTFEAVLVHDAVCYLTTRADLQKAFVTAFDHCKPGGVVIFAPDHTRENFRESAEHGGHDGGAPSMRYLEWTFDPDSTDSTYVTEYTCLLHENGQPAQVEFDTHTCGLFSEVEWLDGLAQAGFSQVTKMPGPIEPPQLYTIFAAVKP